MMESGNKDILRHPACEDIKRIALEATDHLMAVCTGSV